MREDAAFSILFTPIVMVCYKIPVPGFTKGQVILSRSSLGFLNKTVLEGGDIHQGIPLDLIDLHLIQSIYRILIGSILVGLDDHHEIIRRGPPFFVQDSVPDGLPGRRLELRRIKLSSNSIPGGVLSPA